MSECVFQSVIDKPDRSGGKSNNGGKGSIKYGRERTLVRNLSDETLEMVLLDKLEAICNYLSCTFAPSSYNADSRPE